MNKHQYAFNGHGYSYVKIISRILGSTFTAVQLEDGVEFYKSEHQRFLKLVDDDERFIVYFDVPVPSLEKDNPIETIHYHEDPPHHEWIFRARSIEQVITLIEIAKGRQEGEL